MADIPEPIDTGRVTHLTAQMHRSEDDSGDPIPDGYLLAADGSRGHTWLDPAGVGGSVPVEEDGSTVVATPVGLDFRHGLDVTDSSGTARVAVDESELTHNSLGGRSTATAHPSSAITYSGDLTATDVQAAIDELEAITDTIEASVTAIPGAGATPTSLWKPIMVSMPNIVTTDGQPVYVPLVTVDGEAIMALVPVT